MSMPTSRIACTATGLTCSAGSLPAERTSMGEARKRQGPQLSAWPRGLDKIHQHVGREPQSCGDDRLICGWHCSNTPHARSRPTDPKEPAMTTLQTFHLPDNVNGTESDIGLAHDLMGAWQTDGIFQVATDPVQDRVTADAMEASRRFFRLPLDVKARHVSDLTYSGYIASGEEVTAGEADYSEIFTVCKDVPLDDPRVQRQWPCHGQVPWPDPAYQRRMQALMAQFGAVGEKLLRLVALGLDLTDVDALTRLTGDGWHHMRVLRFPARSAKTSRGIGAHTDYGLLVIAAQDDVGGLYVGAPVEGERRKRNWLETESSARMYEDEEPWTYVTPVPSALTVFPGDILQFLTDGRLLSPHIRS